MTARERIILALDVDTADEAVSLANQLKDHVGAFKVGLELINAAGFDIFSRLKDAGVDRIFYDPKFHDIPNTVAGACRAAAKYGPWMINVHASGGKRMIQAAADALKSSAADRGVAPPVLLGVTVLTSIAQEELNCELRVPGSAAVQVANLAKLTKEAGGNGVVASPHEITTIRETCGQDFIIVAPGVRPAGTDAADQRRTMTPGEAVRLGADYLVIGRAITAATDPIFATDSIIAEIENELGKR